MLPNPITYQLIEEIALLPARLLLFHVFLKFIKLVLLLSQTKN